MRASLAAKTAAQAMRVEATSRRPARIEARNGLPFAETVDAAMLSACLAEEYLRWTPEGRLCATGEGRLWLDAMLPALLR